MNKKILFLSLLIVGIAFLLLYMDMQTEVDAETEIQETWIDEEYCQICEEVGAEYHICPELLIAIIETESSGEQYAQNGTCCGLMQINTAVHQERMAKLGITNVWDARSNITIGADLLRELFEQYEDTYTALGAYNGQANVVENVNAGNYSAYATKIIDRARELEQVRGKLDTSQYMTDTEQLEVRAKED